MTTTPMSRMVVPAMALVAAIAIVLVFGLQHIRREPAIEAKAAITAHAASKPASNTPDQAPSALASVQAQAKAVAAALALSPPSPERADGVPAFDVARIEPT